MPGLQVFYLSLEFLDAAVALLDLLTPEAHRQLGLRTVAHHPVPIEQVGFQFLHVLVFEFIDFCLQQVDFSVELLIFLSDVLAFLGIQTTAFFQAGDDIVDFLAFTGHFIELLLENVQQEQHQLDLILDLLHFLGHDLEVDLLQEGGHLLPQLLHLLAPLEMQLQLKFLQLHIYLRDLACDHLGDAFEVPQGAEFVVEETAFDDVAFVLLSVALSHGFLVLQGLSDVDGSFALLIRRTALPLAYFDARRVAAPL